MEPMGWVGHRKIDTKYDTVYNEKGGNKNVKVGKTIDANPYVIKGFTV